MYLTRNQAGVNSASGVRIPPSPPDTQKPPQGGFCVSGGPGTGRAFTRAAHKSVCHHSVTPTFAATACLLTSPTARRRYPIQPPREPPRPSHDRIRPPHPCRRSEEHTSELQSRENLVCRLLLEKKNHNHVT